MDSGWRHTTSERCTHRGMCFHHCRQHRLRGMVLCLCLFASVVVTWGGMAPTQETLCFSDKRDDGVGGLSGPTVGLVYACAIHEAEMEHHDAAYDLLQHVVKIQPRHSAALFQLYLYEAYLRHESVADSLLQLAVSLDPENVDYLEVIADWHERRDSLVQATSYYEKLLERQRYRTDVKAHLCQLYLKGERYDDALRALDRIDASEGPGQETAMARYNIYLTALNDTVSAIQSIRTLTQQYPADLQYRLLLASRYMSDLSEPDSALAIINAVEAEEPDNQQLNMAKLRYAELYDTVRYAALRDSLIYAPGTSDLMRRDMLMGQLRRIVSDSTVAVSVAPMFDRLLKEREDDNVVWATYVLFLELTDAPADDVLAAIIRLHNLVPDDRRIISMLIDRYAKVEDYASLAALCDESAGYYPTDCEFYYFGGISYYQLKKKDVSLERFAQAARHIDDETTPQLAAQIYCSYGDMLHDAGRTDEAFAAYDSCLSLVPDEVGCLNNYAYYLSLEERQLDRAEQMSFRTLRLSPGNRTYIDTYAWILFKQSNYGQARQYIDQCMDGVSSPADADSLGISADVAEHAGDIYMMMGDVDTATRWYRLAIDMHSDNTALIRKKIKKRKYIKQ